MAYTHITPGVEIEICRRAYEVPRDLDISELVKRPPEELSRLEQDSVQKETEIFKRLEAASGEWLEQAAETVSCRRALQYLRTPTPSHTSNARVKDQYGKYEISNMVYIMYWYTYENTRYDRDLKASVPVSWEVSWHLCYNTPRNTDRSDAGRELAGQDRKKFKVKADMEKYINGRIAAYAHLFTEIGPLHRERCPSPRLHRGGPEADTPGDGGQPAGLSGGRGHRRKRTGPGGANTSGPGEGRTPRPQEKARAQAPGPGQIGERHGKAEISLHHHRLPMGPGELPRQKAAPRSAAQGLAADAGGAA